MGLFSFLKSSDKAVDIADKVVDGAVKGIDALFFTAEEKSAASLKAIEFWIEAQRVTLSENSIRSITRRYLAWMIISVFLLLGVFAVAIYRFDPEWSAYALGVMKQLGFMAGAVTVFYFGYYGFKQIVGEKKKNA